MMGLREIIEKEVVTDLVRQRILCPVAGSVLDVRTVVVLRNSDGDPVDVMSVDGYMISEEAGANTALRMQGCTFDATRVGGAEKHEGPIESTVGSGVPRGSESSVASAADETIGEVDRVGVAEPATTTADLPTLPDHESRRVKYLGVIYAPSWSPNMDSPFVFSNLGEARALLHRFYLGGQATVREWQQGAIVEQETRFVGCDSSAEMVLYRMWEDPEYVDFEMPYAIVKIGARGGVSHELL